MIRLATAFALMASTATAQSVQLSADAIDELLSGNTAIGDWDGVPYRQYFGEDGTTIFAQDGARSARGEWRVDTELDEYQSIWPSDDDWQGWLVMEFSGDWYWVSKTTPPTPFQIVEGEHLIAE